MGEESRGLSVGGMGGKRGFSGIEGRENRRGGYCFDNQAVMIDFAFDLQSCHVIPFPLCDCRMGFLYYPNICVNYWHTIS